MPATNHTGKLRPLAVAAVNITDATVISRSPSVLTAEVDGEIVMMSIEQGRYFGLDDIGSDIWKRIEPPCSFAALIDGLTADYEADRASHCRRCAGLARPHGGAGCREAGLMSKLARFAALPTAEQGRTVEAAFYLLAVRLAFGLLPLQRALQLFGIAQSDTGRGCRSAPQAELIGRAIERAARHVPFRAVCLQQAFAALLMLRRRGLPATVQLGLIREGNELKAHAWSLSGDVPVTGVAAPCGLCRSPPSRHGPQRYPTVLADVWESHPGLISYPGKRNGSCDDCRAGVSGPCKWLHDFGKHSAQR